ALVVTAGTALAQSNDLNPAVLNPEKPHILLSNPNGDARTAHAVDEVADEREPNVDDAIDPSNEARFKATTNAVNLTYHGGDAIHSARVVCIFWGPTWVSGGTDAARATNIQAFRNQFGTNSHYGIITQY